MYWPRNKYSKLWIQK